MSHRITLRTALYLALSVLLLGFFPSPNVGATRGQIPMRSNRLDSESSAFQALVVNSSRHDLSPNLSDIHPASARLVPSETEGIEIPNPILPKAVPSQNQETGDEQLMLDMPMAPAVMPTPLLNFDGVSNLFGGWPPDTQGDIGPDHYMQWINLHFAIWRIDKTLNTTTLVYGPAAGNSLFQGFGGACETTNDGDPITLYDPLAQRWFMSQFALPNWPYGPFYECVAVSQTANPTGAWYRYEFQMPVDKMNDYPKFGVWPDAYYMTVNQFNGGSMSWGGAGVAALERSAMLNGNPARMVYFDLYNVNSDYGGMLPADFDGVISPPSNTPGYFVEWDDSSMIPSQDAVRLWEFHVDWFNPDNSTFGIDGDPNLVLPTNDVNPDLCGYSRNCIPQPGTSTKVDAISDRLMYRLQYRNFGGFETLVTNHTVDVSGADRAGIHWFELRRLSGSGPTGWSIYQQGVYSPDANHRWMGSLAMDHLGNLALGYSVSSSSVYPSVRYTGRLATDDLGTLPQGEQSLIDGSGSQTGSSRWGDYSMMGLDPLDDCTFWYTQMYVATTGSNKWRTRIGSFHFPNCTIGFQGTLQGTVIDDSSDPPVGINGAEVRATSDVTLTIPTLTKSDGAYSIQIPVDTYEVTASKYGYLPSTVTDVEVFSGTVTTQDFSLIPAPLHVISGTVSDANTDWSLYAKITIDGAPINPVWSNPVTGFYSVTLPEGLPFNFQVLADLPGYLPASIPVGLVTGDMTRDISLDIDEEACEAPGYQLNIIPAYSSDFEADNGGLTSSGTTSWEWGTPTSGPGVAHSGVNVWATNLEGNYNLYENGYITSTVDLSGYIGESPAISWWQWLLTEEGYDKASLEASKDGGATWDLVYGPVSGAVDEEWKKRHALLDPSYAVGNFLIRFHFTSDSTLAFPGWYVDDLTIGPGSCEPQEGGLVTGNVLDANTTQGLVGATVTSDEGLTTTSQATPLDPDLPDGLYTLFSPGDTHTFTATITGGYQFKVENPNVQTNKTVLQNFNLDAGWLAADPQLLEAALEIGDSITQPLTLTNLGGISATFELFELEKGMVPSGPFEEPSFVVKVFKQNISNSQGLGIPTPPVGAPLSAGEVIQSWEPQGVPGPWGIAYDGSNDSVWVSSPSVSWGGDDKLYEFTTSGTATGRSYPHSGPHSVGPADLAYNWKTGMLWAMNVNGGVANCIFEIDPRLGYTGDKICPGGETGFSISQRGLAYDPTTDTWFAGGWNDLMVYRFDSAGNILNRVRTGLAIAGLAYNPETQHLFVMVNGNPNHVYVLDVADNYALEGEFSVSQDFGSNAGAGMEFDCHGDLWAIDMTTDRVYQFSSGESANLCEFDVPWLEEIPVSGDVGSPGHSLVEVNFDAGAPETDQPGVYQAQLMVKEDTPYYFPRIPVTMTVTAPAAWGKLKGTVSGLGYCDVNPAPLESAEVVIESSGGVSWTLSTTASGYYQRWLDEDGSPYTITISAAGHTIEHISGLNISGGETFTQDVALHWLQSCVSVDPKQLAVEIKIGKSVTVPVTLSNQGYSDSDFEFIEIPVDGALLKSNLEITRPAEMDSPEARNAPALEGFDAPIYAPQLSDILIDEGFEGGSVPPDGWSHAGYITKTWSLYSFSAHTGIYSAYVPYDYDQDEWLISPELYLSEGVLSLWSMGSIYWCKSTHNNCDLNIWIVVGEVGGGDDIFVDRADDDWVSSYTWTQSVFDLTSFLPGGAIRLGFQYLGNGGADIAMDDIILEGKEGGDVPWLLLVPISGALPAYTSNFPIEAIFDAGVPEVVEPGEYHALMRLRSDDPVQGSVTIPVTMTVLPLAYGVGISGDMVSHDIPEETVTYTLHVTNTGEGPTDSIAISLGAHDWLSTAEPWVIGPLNMGESAPLEVAVEIPHDVAGGDFDSVTVTASSVGDPTKFATATITTTADIPLADIEVSKIALLDPVYAGAPLTYEVSITNHGPTKAPRVTLMDVLPLGVIYLGASSTVGEARCTLTDYVLVCEPGKFTIGESRTFTIVVRPFRLGSLINHAFAVADPDDPNPDNNWDFVKVLVEGFLLYFPLISR